MLSVSLGAWNPRPSTRRGTIIIPALAPANVVTNSRRVRRSDVLSFMEISLGIPQWYWRRDEASDGIPRRNDQPRSRSVSENASYGDRSDRRNGAARPARTAPDRRDHPDGDRTAYRAENRRRG